MHEVNIEKANREEARWRILRALDVSRPMALSETVIWRTLCDCELPLSPRDVRRELDFLRDSGLVKLKGEDEPTWRAELTAVGVNVVEYAVPAPAGISRPPRW